MILLLLHVGNTRGIVFMLCAMGRALSVGSVGERRPPYRLVTDDHNQFVLIAMQYQAFTPIKLECA